MKVRQTKMVLLSVFLIATLVASVNGTVWNECYLQASPILCETPEVILQSGTAGTSIIYTNNTSAKASVAASGWLSGWDKRVKITIDQNDVDSALSNFPVLVYLSNSSGRNDDDVSFVFDELQSDVNRKKIAVTTSDGITPCYVEIEKWANANEQAWLWVKVPSVNNTIDTNLYLYYDADHADNTDYVGDSGSTPAEDVWDINHILVWHLSEEGNVTDSTSNTNNGTVTGLTSVVGKMGQAKNSSGGSNGIVSTNNITLGTGQFTVEGWFNPNVYTTQWIGLLGPKDPTIDYNEIMWPYQGRWGYWDWSVTVTSNQPIVAGQWDYYAVVREGTGSNQLKNYINGLYDNAGTSTRNFPAQPVWLGKSSTYPWNGISDELRISNMSRSSAWIKASYESGRDDLLDFGSEEMWNWWNIDYDYRKRITITNNIASTLGSGYSVLLTLDTASLVSSGKMLSNGNDLRIVYLNGSSWVEIDRDVIDMNASSTQIWLKTRADVSASGSDDNYYIYYGNPSAVNPPANKSNVYDFWDDFDDASLDSAWTFSQIGGASGSFSESGTAVMLNATNSGDLWGASDSFLFLSISRSYDVLVESYTSSWGGSHHTWSKMGGVQLRQSLDANSKNRIMSPVYTAAGATNSYRLSTGGGTSEQTTATQPKYNRLSRIGETSRAWYSIDGMSWTELGSQISFTGGLSDPVLLGIHLAGLSSSSHWVEIDWFKARKYVDPEPSTYAGPEERNLIDYVDNNTSDVDPSADKGTHSNFSAQQAGPDSTFDTLTEENITLAMEWGSVSVNDTFETVNLVNSYTSPVVICVPFYTSGVPRTARLQNVSSASFEVRVQNPSGVACPTTTVHYIVVEEGIWSLPDGRKLEALKYNTNTVGENNNWAYDTRNYGHFYSGNLIVLHQVITYNDPTWITTYCSKSDSRTAPPSSADSSFRIALNGAEAVDSHGTETIGYIIIEEGYGTLNGTKYDAKRTADFVEGFDNAPPYYTAFSQSFSGVPEVIVSAQLEMDGGNGGWVVDHTANQTHCGLMVDEDQVLDSERSHIGETCGFWAFENAGSWSTANYELDLEAQWTSVDYDEANEELCIYGGIMGSENIRVDVWNGTAWQNLFSDLTSGWNNVSVSSHLTSSNFTIRFKGGNTTDDTAQDSWEIDATLLHVWTVETHDYVIEVVNQVVDNWLVNLQVYNSSNIGRLSSLNISLHDGTTSNQIAISGGSIVKSEGAPYDLPGGLGSTIYISVSNLQATTADTSYLYVYMKIREPSTSTTYNLFVITFEIT